MGQSITGTAKVSSPPGQNAIAGPVKGDVFSRCKVLLVDDDPLTLQAYAEVVAALGYTSVEAIDALTALRFLADDPAIGIVVTDLHMPAMDGLSLLDEVALRFESARPIVTIVSTGHATMDAAVQAMRNHAQDFLTKPVSTGELAAALRRAAGQWTQLAMRRALDAILPVPDPAATVTAPVRAADRVVTTQDMLELVKAVKRSRDRRAAFFDPNLFADPCWDIMLDLACAQLEGEVVPVSSACAATRLPFSTALRHVRQLVDMGMVRRWKDPKDRRRDLLALEGPAFEAMTNFLVETRKRMP